MLTILLVVYLTILPLCQSQIIGSFPYFRGALSNIPFSGFDSEFTPLPLDNLNFDSRPLVTIKDGTLRGFTMRTVSERPISAFQSIPYAQPPVGALRFRYPVKNLPWNGTLDAVRQSPQCIQLDFIQQMVVTGDEDCLYLNVYVPQRPTSNGILRNVMVFFHGGAFVFGAGSLYGPRYLLDKDVVLVTFNHRLGPFGFFSTGDDASPGNQGLKDQVMVLRWVQENIAAFGGDPNSVTIFGQSSGGSSVGLHIVSPRSRGLFHRAIIHSNSAFSYEPRTASNAATAKRVGNVYKCSNTDSSHKMVECLRKVPAKKLAPVQLVFTQWVIAPVFWFVPTVEHDYPGAFLTKHPKQYYEDGEAANVTLISGLTRDELSSHIVPIFIVPFLLTDLNANWEWVGPSLLELTHIGATTEQTVEMMRKVWSFYIGDRQVTWENRHSVARMLSDRHLTVNALEVMRYHSKCTNQSVYGYYFSYEGRYSTVQQIGGKTKDWGISHTDDIIYLLNCPILYPSLKPGDPELEMSEIISTLWSNFATYDRPCLNDCESSSDTSEIWKPIKHVTDMFSPLRFLNLTLNPYMIDDPYVERYSFWKSLNITS